MAFQKEAAILPGKTWPVPDLPFGRLYNASMLQLVFPLGIIPQPTLETFITGRNAEVVSALRAFAADSCAERSVYLWGPAGSGKSHLLAAVAALAVSSGAKVIRFADVSSSHRDAELTRNTLVVIDDAQSLSDAEQGALFNVYNAVREKSARLVATGTLPPAQLALRPDVKTRLGWGLVYQLHALTDDEKVAALKQRASGRGFTLPDEVARYLIHHGRRDLPWLMAVLDALDQHSLATHRSVTLPLLREVLDSPTVVGADAKYSEPGMP